MHRWIAVSALLTFMAFAVALAADNPAIGTPSGAAAATATTASAPDDSGTASSKTSCGPVDLSKMPDADRDAWLQQRGLKVDSSQDTYDDILIPCPPLDGCGATPDCTGNVACGQTEQTSAVDTGYTTCKGGGIFFSCTNGGTILAVTYNCHRCACCTAPSQPCSCPPTCPAGHGFACSDPS